MADHADLGEFVKHVREVHAVPVMVVGDVTGEAGVVGQEAEGQ